MRLATGKMRIGVFVMAKLVKKTDSGYTSNQSNNNK